MSLIRIFEDQLVDAKHDRGDEPEEEPFLVGDRELFRAAFAPRIGHIREVDARDLADARLPRFRRIAQAVEQGEHVLIVAARDLLVRRCDLGERRHGQQSRHERFRKQNRGFHRGPDTGSIRRLDSHVGVSIPSSSTGTDLLTSHLLREFVLGNFLAG